jgi:type IV pilus assembly protein PilW
VIRRRFAAQARQRGLSLIELMVALVIGLIITAGVMQVFVTSKSTNTMTAGQVEMLENARYAMHLLGRDLRMAGSWGRQANARLVDGRKGDAAQLGNISGDCEAGWYIDLERRLFASNDSNPYASGCLGSTASYRAGSDVLVLRYASPVEVPDAQLVAGTTYLRSSPVRGVLFDGGDTIPSVAGGSNHPLQSALYYIADFSEQAGDGLPSLRRVLLTSGPQLEDELVAAGVEDLQLQIGIDACQPDCDQVVDYYLEPDNALIDWNDPDLIERMLAVRLWTLVRSGDNRDGDPRTFTLGSKTVTTPDDGYRRMLLSSVYYLRNRSKR